MYDGLNRITDAMSTMYWDAVPGFNKYREGGIKYDKNGNILELKRHGLNGATNYDLIDDLVYKYAPYSNQLKGVTDNGSTEGFNNGTTGTNDDYAYDLNGNMTEDLNKGIVKIDYKPPEPA